MSRDSQPWGDDIDYSDRGGQAPTANVGFLATASLNNRTLPYRPHVPQDPLQQSSYANFQFIEAPRLGQHPRSQVTATASQLPVRSKLADSHGPPFTQAWAASEASNILRRSEASSEVDNVEPSIDAQLENSRNSPFEYPLLYDTTSSIRVVRIEPQRGSARYSDIRCTLTSVQPWKDSIPYVCLSYCWGDSSTARQILVAVSGKHRLLTVTENLYNALEELRNTHESIFLWIDAICIDQSNPQERASQVCMMQKIYTRAKSVVVWLGESTSRLSAAMTTMSAIAERFQKDTQNSPDSIVGPSGLRIDVEHTERLESYVPDYAHAYGLVAHFFALPYFRRLWVVQEVCSHLNVTIHLGPRTLPWGSVILAALWQANCIRSFAMDRSYTIREADTSGHLPEIWLALLHTRHLRGLPMMELVSRAREFRASDPRDKVFALLGLTNDLDASHLQLEGLQPNYTKTKAEVYASFAKDLILATGKLDILSVVNTFDARHESQNIISWMPDLDVTVATIRGLGFPAKYNAAFSTSVDRKTVVQQSFSRGQLPTTGFCLDEVWYVPKNLLTFSRDLKVKMENHYDAVVTLWTWIKYIRDFNNQVSEVNLLERYAHLLTSAGFALPTEFPAHPLGQMVATHAVPWVVADCAAYLCRNDPHLRHFKEPFRSYLISHGPSGDANRFGILAGKACHERMFFVSDKGRLGLCPRDTKSGDKIVILYGGSVPYVLRKAGFRGWSFIGECYVDGLMFGEAEHMDREDQMFVLV